MSTDNDQLPPLTATELAAEIKRLHNEYARTRVPGPELFAAIDRLAALSASSAEPVALHEVGLSRDVNGMCIVTVNGREAIRDNGDIISHFATLEWFSKLAKAYVQRVPDHCDRITWRNRYYHLPLDAPPMVESAAEPVPFTRSPFRNGSQWVTFNVRAEHADRAAAALNAAPAAAEQPLTDAAIREVFLANGFTMKDGQSDLKPYVYAAARELLALVLPPAAAEAVIVPDDPEGMRSDMRRFRLTATAEQPAEPKSLTPCNCRWDGDKQVQQCTLHQAHVDAIHEWAERAKTAEKALDEGVKRESLAVADAFLRGRAATAPAPVAPTGLTDDEIFECRDEAHRAFRLSRSGARGQQMTPNDDPDIWFAKAIERRIANTAQAAPVAGPHEYVQSVPDHCDRIVWRNRYYHLPLEAASVAPPDHTYTNQEIAEACEAAPVNPTMTREELVAAAESIGMRFPAPVAEVLPDSTVKESLTDALCLAAVNCPHYINEKRVVLHFNPDQPGHNALDQLSRRLIAAIPAAAVEDSLTDAIEAGDGTLHGSIDYWQNRALAAEAGRDADDTNRVLADNYIELCARLESAGVLTDAQIDAVTEAQWGRQPVGAMLSAHRAFARAIIAAMSAAPPAPASGKGIPNEKDALCLAAINCPHSINEKRVVLHFNPDQPGHNALNQLSLRLIAAMAASSAPEGKAT